LKQISPISHEIILIAGDEIEEAGRDLDTAEGRREVGEVLADWFVVMLTVATYKTLLTLQTPARTS